MIQLRHRRIAGPKVGFGERVFEMEARESTIRVGFGRIAVAWTYIRPFRVTTPSSPTRHVPIRDYAMAVRVAMWAIVVFFSTRRSSND
jgi:hypothetical protein